MNIKNKLVMNIENDHHYDNINVNIIHSSENIKQAKFVELVESLLTVYTTLL